MSKRLKTVHMDSDFAAPTQQFLSDALALYNKDPTLFGRAPWSDLPQPLLQVIGFMAKNSCSMRRVCKRFAQAITVRDVYMSSLFENEKLAGKIIILAMLELEDKAILKDLNITFVTGFSHLLLPQMNISDLHIGLTGDSLKLQISHVLDVVVNAGPMVGVSIEYNHGQSLPPFLQSWTDTVILEVQEIIDECRRLNVTCWGYLVDNCITIKDRWLL